MKRILSTTAFIILIVAIAAVAVYALNGQPAAETAAAPAAVPGFARVAAPDATTENWNQIAMPLDATGDIPNAQAISDNIPGTPGAQEIKEWDASAQGYLSWVPDPVIPGGAGTNFPTAVGGSYWVKLDSSAAEVFSLVGDVPPQTGSPGAVQFNLAGDATNCEWNNISIPLDQDQIINAQKLADSIGDLEELKEWDASAQGYLSWVPDPIIPGGAGTNFTVKIGYPYYVCVSAAGKTWPQ